MSTGYVAMSTGYFPPVPSQAHVRAAEFYRQQRAMFLCCKAAFRDPHQRRDAVVTAYAALSAENAQRSLADFVRSRIQWHLRRGTDRASSSVY